MMKKDIRRNSFIVCRYPKRIQTPSPRCTNERRFILLHHTTISDIRKFFFASMHRSTMQRACYVDNLGFFSSEGCIRGDLCHPKLVIKSQLLEVLLSVLLLAGSKDQRLSAMCDLT